VAVSINLARILAVEQLPDRAGETLVVFGGVLADATFGLVPDQGHVALGCEIGATGRLVWATTVRTQWKSYRYVDARRWLARRVVGTQLATVPSGASGQPAPAAHPCRLPDTGVPGHAPMESEESVNEVL